MSALSLRGVEPFFTRTYQELAQIMRPLRDGETVRPGEGFLSFTRHCPVSNGPAGPNGAVKSVGSIPPADRIEEVLGAYTDHMEGEFDDGYSRRRLDLLLEHSWGTNAADGIDFSLLGSLEMARGHTRRSVSWDSRVSLAYFQPPDTSFEVQGRAGVHEARLYHRFVNAQHDVYHRPAPHRWQERPACTIYVEGVGTTRRHPWGFGQRIL